jgi:hypothetical protein
MQETNGTRPDEQFPAGPYLGRWESFYKYTSKYRLFIADSDMPNSMQIFSFRMIKA